VSSSRFLGALNRDTAIIPSTRFTPEPARRSTNSSANVCTSTPALIAIGEAVPIAFFKLCPKTKATHHILHHKGHPGEDTIMAVAEVVVVEAQDPIMALPRGAPILPA
jgi:hypothetical protein